jgi:hypothetical protein
MEITVNGMTVKLTEDQRSILRATASDDMEQAVAHRQALAQVMEKAWKSGVLEPDLLGNIFTKIQLQPGVEAKFPLDFLDVNNEGSYNAFVVPKEGAIPDRAIEGDELRVPTYKIANAISWGLDYARDARWDVIARAIEVFTNGFVRKINDDGWHVILLAASQNTVLTDTAATSGAFTKKLITDMQTGVKRLTGNRNGRLTDLYVSPEAVADIRNFAETAVDDKTLRALISQGEDVIPSLFGVKLHEMQEFGFNYEFDTYLTGTVGASYQTGDGEFVVGLDLGHRDQFVMPVREGMKMFDDPTLHRSAKAGVYGWMELGFAALDTRRAVLGSY